MTAPAPASPTKPSRVLRVATVWLTLACALLLFDALFTPFGDSALYLAFGVAEGAAAYSASKRRRLAALFAGGALVALTVLVMKQTHSFAEIAAPLIAAFAVAGIPLALLLLGWRQLR